MYVLAHVCVCNHAFMFMREGVLLFVNVLYSISLIKQAASLEQNMEQV